MSQDGIVEYNAKYGYVERMLVGDGNWGEYQKRVGGLEGEKQEVDNFPL